MKDIDMFFPHNDPKTEFVLENPDKDLPDLQEMPQTRKERRKGKISPFRKSLKMRARIKSIKKFTPKIHVDKIFLDD